MCSSDVPVCRNQTSQIDLSPDVIWYLSLVAVELTRRRIDHEVVQVSPSNLGQELSDHAILFRPPPYDAIATILQQESYTHAP